MKSGTWMVGMLVGLMSSNAGFAALASAQEKVATPQELVAAYDSLADTILGAKKTERNVVLSILAATYGRAETMLERAKAKIQTGADARSEVESLAALVAQLGNEGDAAVAGIRKRLIEGGHHHNAAGEQQGLYDAGFVVVTRAAKKAFLASAGEIGKLATAAAAESLDAQWQEVVDQYRQVVKAKAP